MQTYHKKIVYDNKDLFIILKFIGDKNIPQKIDINLGYLFMTTDNNCYYESELISTAVLNNNFEWCDVYFKLIINMLLHNGTENNSYKLLIKNCNKSDELLHVKIIKFIEIINIKQTVFKVTLKRIQKSPFEKIFLMLESESIQQNEHIKKLNTKVNILENDKITLINQIEKININNEKTKNNLYDKFVILLNEKKNKIRELKNIINNN